MCSITRINEWLIKEKKLGSSEPEHVVLATASKKGVVSSRIVYIRDINEKGVLFFTQRGTKKIVDLSENSCASMTLWLPLQMKQVILDGDVKELSNDEKEYYWKSMSRDRQIRFIVNSIRSKNPQMTIDELKTEYDYFHNNFEENEIPMNENYCGFYLVPTTICFYSAVSDGFAEVDFAML
jgi:pyridoxamine 5'-phosphate oxidase